MLNKKIISAAFRLLAGAGVLLIMFFGSVDSVQAQACFDGASWQGPSANPVGSNRVKPIYTYCTGQQIIESNLDVDTTGFAAGADNPAIGITHDASTDAAVQVLLSSGVVSHYLTRSGQTLLGVNNSGITLRIQDIVQNPEIQLQYGTSNINDHWSLYANTTGSDEFFIWGGGYNRLAILQNGNVGIGEENPDATLVVKGQIKIADGSEAADRVLTTDANGLASWSDLDTLGAGKWTLGTTELYPDDLNWDIGIGTSTPSAKLDVVDSVSGSTYVAEIRNTNTGSNLDKRTLLVEGADVMQTGGSPTGYGVFVQGGDATNAQAINHALYSQAGSAVSSGLVFAGSFAGAQGPRVVLIRDDADTLTGDWLGQIMFDSSDGDSLYDGLSSSDAPVVIRAYASEDYTVGDKGGYLDVLTKPTNRNGNESALARLRINQDGSSVFAGNVYLRDSAVDSGDYLVRLHNSSDDGIIDVYQNNTVVARINGAGNSYLASGGNFGINTTNPTAALEVNGNIKTTNGRSLPYITLDSASTGDNWTDQGAHIVLGESASLIDSGTAALHLTYIGNGYSYIGTGALSSGIPTNGYWRFYYASKNIYTDSDLQVVGQTMLGSNSEVVSAGQNLLYGNIDTTSAGNLLLLQTESVDKFSVSAAGDASSTRFCLAGSCISAWSGAGGNQNLLDVLNQGSDASSFTKNINLSNAKIIVGTIDPVYTIDNNNYSTYMAGMIGVKEEVAGVLKLNLNKSGQGEISIDFSQEPVGSDLWLFAQVTNLVENFSELSVSLTAGFPGLLWYEKNFDNNTLIIKAEGLDLAARQVEVSYRLTAPRFDADDWGNESEYDIEGFNLDKLLK